MKNRKCITFDDVLLVPQFSEIISRKEIDLTSMLGDKMRFKLPIISSPMDTVTESSMSKSMSLKGGVGIIHRYNSIESQCNHVRLAGEGVLTGAAIGVTGDFIERSIELTRAGASFLCIDIAHGHHALMRYGLEALRNTLGSDIHIMAGNVATEQGFRDLVKWGANSIRVGIGGGSICSTRIQTGHGMPTLQSILDCASASDELNIPLIADGGIKNSGDIVKALAAGATFVMLGSLLSGTEESPGLKINKDGHQYKEYRGMASSRAQMDWRGKVASREGVSALVPYKGHVHDILEELEAGIRSGLSYSGCTTIDQFQIKSDFVVQTQAGLSESRTHVFSMGIKI